MIQPQGILKTVFPRGRHLRSYPKTGFARFAVQASLILHRKGSPPGVFRGTLSIDVRPPGKGIFKRKDPPLALSLSYRA